ncbi:MAG: GlsB/YeaQ/YmgE family stress response membrane protein [Gemmatimonadetes bacterium]|nr:GlsB/YeaQ/YmgE family stress response membrane protein [Gemmatimonadota bacterium]
MSFLAWVGLGLIVGALAKFIMPGKDPGGLIATVLIGILGALLGGAIGTRLGWGEVTGFDGRSLLVATAGALLLLIAYRVFRRH